MTKKDLATPALLGFTLIDNDHPASVGHRNNTGENHYLKFDHVPYGYVWRWESPEINSIFCNAEVSLLVDFAESPAKALTVGNMLVSLASCNERGFYSALIMHIESQLTQI